VQAELLIKAGKTDQAVQILNDLLKRTDLPGWITSSAREILAQTSQPY
jgi:hypothetical protein